MAGKRKTPNPQRKRVSGSAVRQKATDYTPHPVLRDTTYNTTTEQKARKRKTMQNNPKSIEAQRSARTGATVSLMNKRAKVRKRKAAKK